MGLKMILVHTTNFRFLKEALLKVAVILLFIVINVQAQTTTNTKPATNINDALKKRGKCLLMKMIESV
jgi:hypothetical protein